MGNFICVLLDIEKVFKKFIDIFEFCSVILNILVELFPDMHKITFSTSKSQEVIDITSKIKSVIEDSNVKEGLCFVYTPHTTAALIINENWDPNIGNDLLLALSHMVPKLPYKHDLVDKNASAHIKSMLLGPSETLLFKEKKLFLGKWQAVMFCEFDGPRERSVIVELRGVNG